jgi:hypothetical protein
MDATNIVYKANQGLGSAIQIQPNNVVYRYQCIRYASGNTAYSYYKEHYQDRADIDRMYRQYKDCDEFHFREVAKEYYAQTIYQFDLIQKRWNTGQIKVLDKYITVE